MGKEGADRTSAETWRRAIWLVVIAAADVWLLRTARHDTTPPWDLDVEPLFDWLATLATVYVAGRWIRRPSRSPRVLGVVLALVAIVTNPLTAPRVNDLFRPSGAVTLDNWREHQELHEIAAIADRIDAAGSAMPTRTRRFRCPDEDFVRFNTLRTDGSDRVRYFATNSGRDHAQPVGWYYDEAGALRFVWDHAANRHTFLDAHAEPVWAWRREHGDEGSYGLAVVDRREVALRSASDARARFDEDPVGCAEIR